MKKEDKKMMTNVILLVVLALPCCLMFTDSWFLNFLGVFYTYEYWANLLRPIWKRYRAMMEAQGE